MKFSNCKIGVKVVIKDGATTWFSDHIGKEGTITGVDSSDNTVRVNFSDYYDDADWGNHKDLKMIKEDLNNTILG